MDNESSLRYVIALTFIKGVGPISAKNLIAFYGNAEQIFDEQSSALHKIPGIGYSIAHAIVDQRETALRRADQEIEYLQKHHIRALTYADSDYPFRLKECDDAPLVVYYEGKAHLNDGHFIAFVGTRTPTDYGKNWCYDTIDDLSAKLPNTVIISGLAYGIDITAHKAALKNNIPTIGVVAHGLDRIYPSSHTPIGNKMVQHGGIITEYPMGTKPDKPNFVQRNRIIAGMSDAVVIVESGARGGALLTADAANLYNRDVFALPGRVGDLHSEGCNTLIKQNKAFLIESADDLIKIMNWEIVETTQVQPVLFSSLTQDEQTVLMTLRKFDTLQINLLTIQLKWPVEKLFSLLLEMEFKGLIRSLPGNVYQAIN